MSLEYLGASQRWIRDGVKGKEKALRKDAVKLKGKIKPFISHDVRFLRLSFSWVAGTDIYTVLFKCLWPFLHIKLVGENKYDWNCYKLAWKKTHVYFAPMHSKNSPRITVGELQRQIASCGHPVSKTTISSMPKKYLEDMAEKSLTLAAEVHSVQLEL